MAGSAEVIGCGPGLFGELGEGGADAGELGGGELGPFVVGVAGQVRIERARDHPGEAAEDLPELPLVVLDPVRGVVGENEPRPAVSR